MCTSDTVDCAHNEHYSQRIETVWVVYNIVYNDDTIQLPGAHEWKKRSTTRNGVLTMKHLTRELVLPYKEAQFHLLFVTLYNYYTLSTLQLLQCLPYKVKPLEPAK